MLKSRRRPIREQNMNRHELTLAFDAASLVFATLDCGRAFRPNDQSRDRIAHADRNAYSSRYGTPRSGRTA
jgi:hypothetical protein